MSEKERRRKKSKKEGEVIKPKRKRARKKEAEEVIEPLEEHVEKEGKKWYIISLDFIKVLYSPVRTFKRIAKNPDIKGPIFILALILLVLAGYIYAWDTKVFNEPFVLDLSLIPGPPDSPGPPYNITQGFINPAEKLLKASKISVFTFNWTGTVTIYGTNDTGGEISESIVVSEEVLPHNTTKAFATVSKVTFEGPGDQRSQFVILGMVPREYHSATEGALFDIPYFTMNMVIYFILFLALYGGVLLFTLKVFRQEVESWSALFIVIGYTLAVMIVEFLARTLLILTRSETKLPLEAGVLVFYFLRGGYSDLLTENAKTIANGFENQINQGAGVYSNWALQLQTGITYAVNIWMVALWVVALRSCYGFSWKKAAAISAVAFISEFFLRNFIGLLWELMIIGVLILLIKYVFK